MLFWAILFTSIIVGAEVDIFVPSFPELQEAFKLDPFRVELVLSLNLITYGVGSFWAGIWGDRYGHKHVTVAGVLLFCVGSLMCWWADTFSVLLLGRVIQGLGVAAPAVLIYAWMMEVYPENRHVSLVGLVNGVSTFAVSGAPILGSFVTLWWGWRGNFALLFAGSIVAWLMCQMCEAPPRRRAVQTLEKEASYLDVCRNKFAVYIMGAMTGMGTTYYIFVGIAPILYREGFGVSLSDFGWYQGSICFSFAAMSLLTGSLVARWGAAQCVRVSLMCLVASCLGIVWLVVCDNRNPMTITFFMNVFAVGCAVPVTILYPFGLNAMPEAKGKIAAVQVASRLVLTAVGLQIAGYVYNGSFISVGIVLLVTLLGSLWCMERLYRTCDLASILKAHSKDCPA